MLSNNQRLLLITLRIKKRMKAVNEAIEWNFGYCPSHDSAFDELLDKAITDKEEFKSITGKYYEDVYDK